MASANETARLRVHVENNAAAPEVDHVTAAKFKAAAAAYPGIEAEVAITFGADPARFAEILPEAEILIAGGGIDLSNLAARAPRLKWIQSISAGVEKLIPLVPKGVVLTNASGVHGPKGGEYALTALLMLNHRVPQYVTNQRAARWDQQFATPIAGKTLVLIGTGAIGTAAARLARRFGMRILGVSRSGRPHRLVERMYRPQELHHVLPEADFVLVTTPLTAETRGLLGRAELDLLPRRAGIVNLGRGAVIDNEALAEKLRRSELAGAVLDVFPEEPLPPGSPLWATPNLIISPHCAVDDAETYAARVLDIFLRNLTRYAAGRRLINVVDARRGY